MIPDTELEKLPESEQIAYIKSALEFIVELNNQISRQLGYTPEEPKK